MIRTHNLLWQGISRCSTCLDATDRSPHTPDPASAIQLILSTFKADETPALHWDAVRGIVGLNEAGRDHVPEILGELEPTALTPKPSS